MGTTPMTAAQTHLVAINTATEWADVNLDGAGVTIEGLRSHIEKYKTAITDIHTDSASLKLACATQEGHDTQLMSEPTKEEVKEAEMAWVNADGDTAIMQKKQVFQETSGKYERARTTHKSSTEETRPEFKLTGSYEQNPFSPTGSPYSPSDGNPSSPGDSNPPSPGDTDPSKDDSSEDDKDPSKTDLSSDENTPQQQQAQQQPQQQGQGQQQPQGGSPQQQPQMSPSMTPNSALKPMSDKPDDDRDYDDGPFPRTETSSDDKAPPVDRGTSTMGATTKDVSGKPSGAFSTVAPGQGSNTANRGMMGGGMMGGAPMGGHGGGGHGGGGKKKRGGILSADPDQLGSNTSKDAVTSGVLSKDTLEKKEEAPHIMLIPETPKAG